MRAAITEPEPGRVLVERDAVTTFTVGPAEGGKARVTISIDMNVPGGPVRWLQKKLITRLLRPVYVREIQQLGRVGEERT
jgi:hypothetical protein